MVASDVLPLTPWGNPMPSDMPRLFLARHGDTAWTDSRQRTGRTDLPLNEHGEERARGWASGFVSFPSLGCSPALCSVPLRHVL